MIFFAALFIYPILISKRLPITMVRNYNEMSVQNIPDIASFAMQTESIGFWEENESSLAC